MSNKFAISNSEFLLSYGEFVPDTLKANITIKFNENGKDVHLETWCEKSIQYPNLKPELYIFCSPTRFGATVQTDLRNDRYEAFPSLSLNNLAGAIECEFVIYNSDYDILQRSERFKIQLEDNLGEEYPQVLWLDFSKKFPSIKDCYWYIQADHEAEMTIAFNSIKPNFQEAIESDGFADMFRDEFLRHFRSIYCTALILDPVSFKDNRLQDLLIPDNPFHFKIALELQSYKEFDDPWIRYALLNQEISGLRKIYDRLLTEAMRVSEY